MAKRILPALCAMALAACGEQASQEQEALELLTPPAGAVLGVRLNPATAQARAGLLLEEEAIQRVRVADNNIRADSGLRWRVGEVIPGANYVFELTASRQEVAFGSMLSVELRYPEGAETLDCQFRVSDGALKFAGTEATATERDGVWVFPCEATTRPELQNVFVTLYPAVSYSSFVPSPAVTGAIEYRTLSFNRTQSGSAAGG